MIERIEGLRGIHGDVDAKWRLTIPREVSYRVGRVVYACVDTQGTIRIRFSMPSEGSYVWVPVAVKAGVRRSRGYLSSTKRVVIPRDFRGSLSFYLGRHVLLVREEEEMALWPWPKPSRLKQEIA